MEQWAYIKNISGLDVYVNYYDHIIFEITVHKPDVNKFEKLPEHFAYIENFLEDHTKQPMLIEALDDLDLSWTTPFQLKLYKTLALIPCGTLISYGALAELVGRPGGAARAVGAAMSANRFCIIIPAHRVVRAGRKISGKSCMKEDPRVTLLHSEGVFDFEE